jgi:replicative DNA helicase
VHLSDIKGSSAIRQNLDQAILIDRAHLKNPDVGSAKYNEQKQRAELLVGKARDGAPGMLSVVAVDRHFRFEDARS